MKFNVNDFGSFNDVTLTVSGVAKEVDIVNVEFGGTITTVWTRPIDYTDAFISEWNIEHDASQVIQIACINDGPVDCEVDWGDGKKDRIKSWNAPQFTHEYAFPGSYTVRIAAPQVDGMSFPGMNMESITHPAKAKIFKRLVEVKQLGIVGWKSLQGLCYSAENLGGFTLGNHNTDSVTSTVKMFYKTPLTAYPIFNTVNVTDFTSMFNLCMNNVTPELYIMDSAIKLNFMFRGNDNLTSVPIYNTSSVQEIYGAWQDCKSLVSFPVLDFNEVIMIGYQKHDSWTNDDYGAWMGCEELLSFPVIDFPKATSAANAWRGCIVMASFPVIAMPLVTDAYCSWYSCKAFDTFPLIDIHSVENLVNAWGLCENMTTFPLLVIPAAKYCGSAWYQNKKLTVMPDIDMSSVENITSAWSGCSVITGTFTNLQLGSNMKLWDFAWSYCPEIVKVGPLNLGASWGAISDMPKLRCFDVEYSGVNTAGRQRFGWNAIPQCRMIRRIDSSHRTDSYGSYLYGSGNLLYPSPSEKAALLHLPGVLYKMDPAINCENMPIAFRVKIKLKPGSPAPVPVGVVESIVTPTTGSDEYTIESKSLVTSFSFDAATKANILESDIQLAPYINTFENTYSDCVDMTSSIITATGADLSMYIKSTKRMFYGCASLASIPMFQTSQSTDWTAFASGCNDITVIPDYDYTAALYMSGAFAGTAITENPASMATTLKNAVATDKMFIDCDSMTTFNVFDTSKVLDFMQMFSCYAGSTYSGSLTSLPAMDFSSSIKMWGFLLGQKAITSLPPIVAPLSSQWQSCFEGMSALVCIKEIDTTGITYDSSSAFGLCGSLTAPNASEQAQLIVVDAGLHYTNPTACP